MTEASVLEPKRESDTAARWCVAIALVFTIFVNIPMFLFTTVFGDDWAWVWVHHWQGAAGIQEYMWRVAHPGFGPVYNFEYLFGGDEPGRVARLLAVTFHLGSAWLLWRIFRDGRAGSLFAATVAALYLSAPYLGSLRATQAHSVYDICIFFYLLSILLSARPGMAFLAAALAAHFVGLLLETLASLEIIRWWLLYRRGYDARSLVRRAAPFLLLIVGFTISRATWMAPYGEYYAGHNALMLTGVSDFFHHVYLHLSYYFDGSLKPLRYVPSLFLANNLSRFLEDSVLIGGPIILFALALGIAWSRASVDRSRRGLAELAVVGVLALGAGMLPYVAIQREPDWEGFYSRLVVASQFGVFILVAAFICALPSRIGAVTFAVVMFLASSMQMQFGKWMIYDHLVVQDFQSQLAKYFARNPNQLLFVKFVPDAHDVLFVRRCLANYDVNVALDVKGIRSGGLAYNVECDADQYTEDGKCGVTAFVREPCPPKHLAEFRLHDGMEDFTRLPLIGLARLAVSGQPLDAGTLIVDPTVAPPSRAPPSRPPGT